MSTQGALEAIAYVLAHAQTDADFAFVMAGTESLRRLCEAFVELDGRGEDARELARAVSERPLYRDRPEILRLRDRVSELEAQLAWYHRFVSQAARRRCEEEVRNARAA